MPEATIAEPPPAPPAPHPGAVTIDLGNLGKKPAPVTDVKVETTPPVVEPPKEEKAPEVPPVVPPPAKPNDKEHNMAELRKSREAAEAARRDIEEQYKKLQAEYEALKTKAPELPEDVKTKMTELEKEREELRQHVRQTDLARDPEFQAKFNKPIMERLSTMGQTAISAGVPEADWKAAVANWDENQFAEWTEAMTPIQKVKFTAAWTAAVDLHQQQQAELKNADVAYTELQKKRQADQENQQKTYFSQNEQMAKAVMAETIKPETLKEYEDLAPATEALLMKAARHEIPAKDIFQQLAANQVLSRVTVKQSKEIETLREQLAERDKKISEQDAFIANQAGSVPHGDAAGGSGSTGEKTPAWRNIVIKAP